MSQEDDRAAERSGIWASLIPPIGLGAAIVAAAPFWGSLVPRIRSALGREGLWMLMTVVLLAAFTVLVAAAVRRLRRPGELSASRRWALLATALALVALQLMTGSREEAAVERIHFVMYGLLALLVVRALGERSGWWSLPVAWLASTTFGVLDEFVQWWVPVRTGDLFDVGLNCYAAVVGALAGAALYPPRGAPGGASRGGRHLFLLALALTMVLGSTVAHQAHLGYRIEDPQIGSFQSFFTAAQLKELDRRRGREWAVRRPGPLRALEKEDYFRTEAGWHVRARNRFRSAGDAESSWREERILQVYYSAFLDLRRGNGEFLHRIPEPESRELERLYGGSSAAHFRSVADNGRIWLVPSKPQLWWATGIVAAVLLLTVWRSPRAP